MRVKVKVIPRSSQSQIEQSPEGDLRVKVKSAPIKGKANQELIELLAKYYKVPKSRIEIAKGVASREKIIEINIAP